MVSHMPVSHKFSTPQFIDFKPFKTGTDTCFKVITKKLWNCTKILFSVTN